MSHRLLESVRRHRGRLVVGLTALLTAAAALVVVPQLASAAPPPPPPTELVVDSALSFAVPNTPGRGSSYVVKDVPFTVSFHTDQPLSTTRATTVSLTVAASGPDPAVTVTTSVAKYVTTGSFTGLLRSAAANDVLLTVTAQDDLGLVGTLNINVLDKSVTVPKSANVTLTGIGGGGGPGVPCVATPADQTCGDLRLPETGGVLSDQFLSQGLCPVGIPCRRTGPYSMQAIVAIDSATYNRANPIEFVAKCDKTLCPGKGVKDYGVYVQVFANTPPVLSPPCAAKGVVGSDQDFCTDYIQSKRDGAGDVHLYVEARDDLKIIW